MTQTERGNLLEPFIDAYGYMAHWRASDSGRMIHEAGVTTSVGYGTVYLTIWDDGHDYRLEVETPDETYRLLGPYDTLEQVKDVSRRLAFVEYAEDGIAVLREKV